MQTIQRRRPKPLARRAIKVDREADLWNAAQHGVLDFQEQIWAGELRGIEGLASVWIGAEGTLAALSGISQ